MAHLSQVRVLGTGRGLPDAVLTNRELFEFPGIRSNFDVDRARNSLRDVDQDQRLSDADVFDRWAIQLAGIRERRILPADQGLTTEHLCAEAAEKALADAGMVATDIDHIVIATMTGSDTMPNAGCTVANLLGIPKTSAYSVNAACAGFVYAMAQGWASVSTGMVGNTLVIGGDVMSRITSYADPKTAVLFGDGAGAVVLGTDGPGPAIVGRPVLSGSYARDPLFLVGQGWETAEEPSPKLHMLGGPSILRRAVGHMTQMGTEALASGERTWSQVSAVIPHQANQRITQALAKKLDMRAGQVVDNIARYGNLSAGTVSAALDEVLRGEIDGASTDGLIVLTAVGGGYATGALVLDPAV